MFDVKLYLYINNSKTANFFLPFLTFFWYKSQLMYKKKVVLMVDSSKVDVALIITSQRKKQKSLSLLYLSAFEVLLQEHLLFCHYHLESNVWWWVEYNIYIYIYMLMVMVSLSLDD